MNDAQLHLRRCLFCSNEEHFVEMLNAYVEQCLKEDAVTIAKLLVEIEVLKADMKSRENEFEGV